jgi:hypothetical protein
MIEQKGKELHQLQKPLDPVRLECKLAVEAISSIAGELASLLIRHYDEVGIDPTIPYNPDWSQYLSYELTDSCIAITARYDGILIGYALYLIGPFKHNKDVLYADLDAIWISPAFRSGFLAMKMLKMGEAELKGKVGYLMATSTTKNPIDILFKRLDFRPIETVYWKKLGEDHG